MRFRNWFYPDFPEPKPNYEERYDNLQRLKKIETEILELYKRCDLLLQCDAQAEETLKSITDALDRLTHNQNAMAETLKQMTH